MAGDDDAERGLCGRGQTGDEVLRRPPREQPPEHKGAVGGVQEVGGRDEQMEQAANERLREPHTCRDHGEAEVEEQVCVEVGAKGEAVPRHLEPLRGVSVSERLLQPELVGAGGRAAGEAGGEVGDPGDDAGGMVDGRLLGHGLSSSISPAGMAPGSRRRASRSTQPP